jgi:hypothetical protein
MLVSLVLQGSLIWDTCDALDYFFESDLAIAYAARWARMWIDNRRLPRA